MQIREATGQDIPRIVELLKMSLGESLMPKSEAYWRWKHVNNPFGKSPVLLAEESGVIIGVRAFMRWEWTDGKNIYKAVRAVDTATHPQHQGKGIFKKLTLQLIETSKEEGVHFVFNTPNAQSRPGYLKMGWEDAGRLPIRIMPGNPMAILAPKLFQRPQKDFSLNKFLTGSSAISLVKNAALVRGDHFTTNYSPAYLHWRYCQVPVADYQALYVEDGEHQELVIYRLKPGKAGVEFRVTDYLGDRPSMSSAMRKQLRAQANQVGAAFITFTGTSRSLSKGLVFNKGPMVTIRNIQHPDFNALRAFREWNPTLGDLELF